MFFRILIVLFISYIVFLILAHVTHRQSKTTTTVIEPFDLPGINSETKNILHAQTSSFDSVKHMTVNQFVTYTHQTLAENSHIINGPIYRRDPNAHESISAFVRRCVRTARRD